MNDEDYKLGVEDGRKLEREANMTRMSDERLAKLREALTSWDYPEELVALLDEVDVQRAERFAVDTQLVMAAQSIEALKAENKHLVRQLNVVKENLDVALKRFAEFEETLLSTPEPVRMRSLRRRSPTRG